MRELKFIQLVAHAEFSRAKRNHFRVDGSTESGFVLGEKESTFDINLSKDPH